MIEKIADYIAEQLLIKQSDQLVDIGCGEGELTLALAGHCNFISGLDQDKEAVQKAGEASPDNARFIVGDAYHLPHLITGQCDKIVCYATFQYFNSIEKGQNMLKTMVSSLGHDGAIFLGDIPVNLSNEVPWNAEGSADWSFGKFWTPDELTTIGKAVGLKGYRIERPAGLLASSNRFDFILKKEKEGNKVN